MKELSNPPHIALPINSSVTLKADIFGIEQVNEVKMGVSTVSRPFLVILRSSDSSINLNSYIVQARSVDWEHREITV